MDPDLLTGDTDIGVIKMAMNSMYGKVYNMDMVSAYPPSVKALKQMGEAVYSPPNKPPQPNSVIQELGQVFPNILRSTVPHPVIGGTPDYIYNIVIDLNDGRGWTREQIADWLDSLPVDLTLQPESKGD